MVTICDACGEPYATRREAKYCAIEDRRLADWQRQERASAGVSKIISLDAYALSKRHGAA
jgi:hypothetical protein